MDKLPLIDKDVRQKLEMIFFDIREELQTDEEIVMELTKTLKELKELDKDLIINYIKLEFEKFSFLEGFIDQVNGPKKIDYESEYKEALKASSYQKLLELIKQQQFWEQNTSLKFFKQYSSLLIKLQNKIIDFFDLIENSQNDQYFSQFELLKRLLRFVYQQPDQLLNEENNSLLQIIGSLLVKQIYQLQSYLDLDSLIKQNEDYFDTFISILQKEQIKVQHGQIIDKKFFVIFELFSQDLTKSKENLDLYIQQNLGLTQSQLNFEEIMHKLEQSNILQDIFYALYFRVITFLWIQYCQQFNLIPSLTKIQEQSKSKPEIQTKQTIYSNFIKKSKTNDQIHTYLLQNVVYFTHQSQQSYHQETLKQFQISQDNNFLQFKEETDHQPLIEKLLSSPFEEFKNIWSIIQQMQFNLIVKDFKNNQLTDQLLLFLWKNRINIQIFDALKEILNNKKDLLIYAMQLDNNGFESGITIDLLTIATTNYNFDINNLKFLGNVLFTFKKFIVCDQIILKNIFRCHVLYQEKQLDQFVEESFKIYKQNKQIYSIWLEPFNYFSIYQITPQVFSRKQYFSEYPQNMNISLEEFNISLAEQTKKKQQESVKNWVAEMNNSSKFKELMPFFFNIIKRGQGSDYFTQQIYVCLEQENKQNHVLNMKALFQIFFNNSDQELKVMLLKLYSQQNPVPFVYQNYEILSIKNEEDLYSLNHHLYYVFPESYTIINFTLSKKTSKFGKTELINNIFYGDTTFEVSDDCQMNQNTIDLMMDFSFNGTRYFSIADAHGIIPISILQKILHLFNLWIIQMDTESEIEENFVAFQQLIKCSQKQSAQVCFIVRNSTNSGQDKYSLLIQKVKANKIHIHFVQNLTQNEINSQCQKQELVKASTYILNLIKPQNHVEKLMGKNQFFQMQNNFESKSEIVKSIQEATEIMMALSKELNNLVNEKDGFFSSKAFPIRSLEYNIKETKDTIVNLQQQFGNQQKEKQQELLKSITQFQQSLQNQPHLSTIQNLFYQILKSKNFYILLIWFTETLQQFNKKINSKLHEENKLINNQIEDLNQEREKLKSSKKDEQKSIENIKKQSEELIVRLTENLREQALKNIGIEIFWREMIKHSQQDCQQINLNLIDIVYGLIMKGEPFEFLDGDNLTINNSFLQKLALKFKQDSGKSILTFSVLGPQSSGKSTVLNKIFGCHFLTSVGRCTKGIYLQLIKVQDEKQFNKQIDYVLLLDTEGLSNPNRLNKEFDKKIALLVLAVSDIILITVKGDISFDFKNLIEMGIYTLGQLKGQFSIVKTLSWCFNQNNDTLNKQAFRSQIEIINNNLNLEFNRNEMLEEKVDYAEILNIHDENIHILGFAFQEKCWSLNLSHETFQWQQYKTQDGFLRDSWKCGIQTILNYVKRVLKKECKTISSLRTIFENINEIWQSIIKLADLVEFSELIQYKNNQFMKNEYDKCYKAQDTRFTQNIQQEIEDEVNQLPKKSMVSFRQIQEKKENQINVSLQRIKQIVQEAIQNTKVQKKISKKIALKYLEQLDLQILHLQLECRLKIIEEIQNHSRKYQEEQGFTSIFDYVQSLKQTELEDYRNNPEKIHHQFEVLWGKNTQDQVKQHENTLLQFQKNEFEAIKSAFQEYYLNSEKDETYQNYFIENINKFSPLENSEYQKNQIYDLFEEELTQPQFMTFENTQKNLRYTQNFFLTFKKKLNFLKKQTSVTLINLHIWFDFSVKFSVISKKDITEYFKQNYEKDLICFIHQNFTDLAEIHNYVGLLKLLKIQYNEQSLQALITEISSSFKNVQLDNANLQKLCQNLCQTLNFDQNQSIRLRLPNASSSVKQYFQNSLNIQRKQFILATKELIKIKEKELMEDYIIVEKQKKTQPKSDYDSYFPFQHIIAPQDTPEYSFEFKENFPKLFNQQFMKKNGCWKKIYSELYDFIEGQMKIKQIKKKFEENNQQIQNDDVFFDGGVVVYTMNQISMIMVKIQGKIKNYNEQLATVGLIFTSVGERYLFYYSLFIIWRFICFKKWKNLKAHQEKLESLRQGEFEKFKLEIYQNKQELSIMKAKIFVDTLVQGMKQKFIKENRQDIQKELLSKKQTSNEIIKLLDEELLIQQKRSQNDILEYLQDQSKFIETYVDSLINVYQSDLEKSYILQLQKEIKQPLSIVYSNTLVLKNLITENIRAKDYFNQEDLKKDEFYDNLLYQIVLYCLQGDESPYFQAIEHLYKDVFRKNRYKQVKIYIELSTVSQQNQQIQILKAFIEEVSKQLLQTINSIDQITLSIKQFDVQSQLDEIKLQMNGCQETCPICKRKCDEDIMVILQLRRRHHAHHSCKNGHQLRGMNKVMIDNKPSLFTCEEMENSDLIIIQESQEEKTWEKIKSTYTEWNFRGFQDELMQANLIKMTNLWNSGIGELMCQRMSAEEKKFIQFEQKHDQLRQMLQNLKTHYILVLDDSGSMKGEKWENAKKGAISSMNEIRKNVNAKVSVIIFNETARISIECEKVELQQQGDEIDFQNGNHTDFSQCFKSILHLIEKYQNEEFEKTVILFFTDGLALYPEDQIQKMINLPENIRQSITFLICTDLLTPSCLQQIELALKPYFCNVQLRLSVQTSQIKETWTEIVKQNYHKLRL